jgi:hypothetical protein
MQMAVLGAPRQEEPQVRSNVDLQGVPETNAKEKRCSSARRSSAGEHLMKVQTGG